MYVFFTASSFLYLLKFALEWIFFNSCSCKLYTLCRKSNLIYFFGGHCLIATICALLHNVLFFSILLFEFALSLPQPVVVVVSASKDTNLYTCSCPIIALLFSVSLRLTCSLLPLYFFNWRNPNIHTTLRCRSTSWTLKIFFQELSIVTHLLLFNLNFKRSLLG